MYFVSSQLPTMDIPIRASEIVTSSTLSSHFCVSAFFHPYAWSIHVVEALTAILSLILNTGATIITYNAIPIPIPQRRVMAYMAINYGILAGFQLSRNIFLLFSLMNPCMIRISTVNCKLEEFPLVYCYIHAGALSLALSLQTTHSLREERRFLSWASSCSIWQSTLAIICMAATLLFTAFDDDSPNSLLTQCSLLMAIRERQLGFWLLSVLIVMHAISALVVNASAFIQLRHSNSERTLLSLSFKDVISLETSLWEIAFLLTGIFTVYQFVATYVCDQCLIVALELSFVVIPLFISFLHPLVIVWNVLPLRDAAVRVFPSLSSIVPEYAFIPPPPTGLLHNVHFGSRTSNTAYLDGGLETTKIILSPKRAAEMSSASKIQNPNMTRQMSY
uniref:Uncharacterized protein n=1 Tax=Parascaris univalens TaxID=6257 RepID=A0A915BDS9_PARUN